MAMTGKVEPEVFAAATLTVVGRDGFDRVSFRSVAAEAGWSVGALQNAFPTREDLLAATLRLAQQRSLERIGASEPGTPTLRAWLVALVLETLPLDAERRAACLVDVAFTERAPFTPGFAEAIAAWEEGIRIQLGRLFAGHQSQGGLHPSVRPDRLARAILALGAGLATQLLYDPVPEEDVRELLDATIAALLREPV
jgi:AcrR family transcriptional regulator